MYSTESIKHSLTSSSVTKIGKDKAVVHRITAKKDTSLIKNVCIQRKQFRVFNSRKMKTEQGFENILQGHQKSYPKK